MPGNPNILSNSATPEMLNSSEGLPIFFGWAERAHPQGVKDLVNLIGSILPQGGRADGGKL